VPEDVLSLIPEARLAMNRPRKVTIQELCRPTATRTVPESTIIPATATFSKKPDPRYSDPEFLMKFIERYRLVTQTLTVGLKGNRLTHTTGFSLVL